MTVLVPIDESDCSFRALEFAIGFSDRFETDLHVVHFTDHHTEATDELLDRAKETLQAEGIDDEPEVITEMKKFRAANRIGEHISKLAGEEGYEHIVMGHHGSGAAERLLLGSAAETVVESTEVPVTVVP